MNTKNITTQLKSKENWKKVGWGAAGLTAANMVSNAASPHLGTAPSFVAPLAGGGAATLLALVLGKNDAAVGSLIGTGIGVLNAVMPAKK